MDENNPNLQAVEGTTSSSVPQESTEHSETQTISDKNKGNSEKKSSLTHYLTHSLWKDVLLICAMTYIFINFIGFRAVIPSGSMEPTLKVGNSYLVNRMTTYFGENKGLDFLDIVVFTHEEEFENDDFIVKRVIGLPGDSIEIRGGRVYRNSEVIAENYVKNKEFSLNMEEIVIPENRIFVMGDNRTNSHDSRFWEIQTVSLDNIVGEMIVFGDKDN